MNQPAGDSGSGARGSDGDVTREANKATVLAFYQLAFQQRRPEEAVARCVGDRYVQHNPEVGDGKQAFIDFVNGFTQRFPTLRLTLRRIVAEGDLVVMHSRATGGPGGRDAMVVDIFRLEAGRIVEHWDVIQPVPDHAANSNGMD